MLNLACGTTELNVKLRKGQPQIFKGLIVEKAAWETLKARWMEPTGLALPRSQSN